MGDYEHDRHLANMAQTLAAKHPARALDLLEKMRSPGARERACPKVCHALATVDLDQAEQLAESIELHHQKSLAYGYLAQVTAERDPPRAFELLERGVDLQIEAARGNKYYFNNFTNPAIIVARLAQLGRDIGYPDVPGLVLRALSLPLRAKQEFDPTRVREAHAPLAFCLAWVDPQAARGLLQPITDSSDLLQKGGGGGFNTVVWALAALDPEWAAEFVKNLPEDDPTEKRGRKARELLRLANFLLTEPEKRRETVMTKYAF